MKVLLYAAQASAQGRKLKGIVASIVSAEEIETYPSIGNLVHRLRQPRFDVAIAILMATSREDLSDILSLKVLLGDIRIILILPDRKKDTIAKGHKLYPRFLTFIDSDFKDMAAVLAKMLKRFSNDEIFSVSKCQFT